MGFNVSTPPQGWGNLFRGWLISGIQLLWRRQNSTGAGNGVPGGDINQIQYNQGSGFFNGIPYGDLGQGLKSGGDGNLPIWEDVIEPVNADWNAVSGLSEILNKPNVVENPFTEEVSAGGFKLTNVASPDADTDVANKAYVDTFVTGLSPKTAVRVATAAALPAGTYDNGTAGVGATFTVTATGILAVDGVNTVLGDRILVTEQVAPAQNGIYIVSTEGEVGVSAILTRTTDADTGAELVSAYTYTGAEGATLANKGFVQGTPATITVGTSPIVWNLFNSNAYGDGTGITIGAGNLIYSNLSTGVAGPGNTGQPVRGGTTSEGTLTIVGSTSTDPRTTTAPAVIVSSAGPLGDDNTAQVHMSIPVTVAQSATAGYTALRVSVTETSTGSGAKYLINLLAGASGTTSMFSVDNSGNIVIPGTISVTALAGLLNTANTWTKAQRGAFVTLTDAATIAVDASLSNNFMVVLGGNRTLGVPTNLIAGQSGVFNVWQDITGSRALAFSWCYQFPSGTVPTVTSTKGTMTQLSYIVNSATSSSSITGTNATPAVFTWTGHGLITGQKIQFSAGTTTVPALNTSYWITVVDANTFRLSTSETNMGTATFITGSGMSGSLTGASIGITLSSLGKIA